LHHKVGYQLQYRNILSLLYDGILERIIVTKKCLLLKFTFNKNNYYELRIY